MPLTVCMAPAPAHHLSAGPNTGKPSPQTEATPVLCPCFVLCLLPVFLSQNHKELLCFPSVSLFLFPHLIWASDLQEFKT